MAEKTRVTFAYPYVDRAGKAHEAGKSIELDPSEARGVIRGGVAREADAKADTGKVAK